MASAAGSPPGGGRLSSCSIPRSLWKNTGTTRDIPQRWGHLRGTWGQGQRVTSKTIPPRAQCPQSNPFLLTHHRRSLLLFDSRSIKPCRCLWVCLFVLGKEKYYPKHTSLYLTNHLEGEMEWPGKLSCTARLVPSSVVLHPRLKRSGRQLGVSCTCQFIASLRASQTSECWAHCFPVSSSS